MAKIAAFYLVPPVDWLFPNHGDVAAARLRAEQYRFDHGTYIGAEYQIEEFVRQWALSQLIKAYDYPPDWMGEKVIIEEPVKMGSTEKEADISIRNVIGRTYLYIEVKKRGIANDEFDEAERQLETYLAATYTATIGMITDGDRVRTIQKKTDPNDFHYIPDLPACGIEAVSRTQLVRELPPGIDPGRKTGLDLLDHNYERLLFDCHSLLRSGFQNSRASLGATRKTHAAWSRLSTMKPSRS